MTTKQKDLIHKWADDCETHEDWLAIVGFCLPTLLEDQATLWGLIANEAKRQVGPGDISILPIQQILRELLLHLEAI